MAERDIGLRITVLGEDAEREIERLRSLAGGGHGGRASPGGRAPRGGGGGGGSSIGNIADLAGAIFALKGVISQIGGAAGKFADAVNEQVLQKSGVTSGVLTGVDAASRVRGMMAPFEFAMGSGAMTRAEGMDLASRMHHDIALPQAKGAAAVRDIASALMIKENEAAGAIIGGIAAIRVGQRVKGMLSPGSTPPPMVNR